MGQVSNKQYSLLQRVKKIYDGERSHSLEEQPYMNYLYKSKKLKAIVIVVM